MRLHIITVGAPKLTYAKQGWGEYLKRLSRYHNVRVTHIADKRANDTAFLLQTASNGHKIALVIGGQQFSSPDLSKFLDGVSLEGREVCFVIGGPEGLPEDFISQVDDKLSLSKLTFPHDLAMVVLLEALYRASTISAGRPYHK